MLRSFIISCTILYMLVVQFNGFAQPVISTPAFPTVNDEVTLIFDLTQVSDPRAEGLLGLTDDVFLWSGAGEQPGSGPSGAFEFIPPGQDNFNEPYEPGRMTSLGNDRWSITLTISEYYNIPEADLPRIGALGLLLKNGDGSAQTEDLFLSVFQEDEFGLLLNSPVATSLTVEDGEEIPINIDLSDTADVEIFVDDISEVLFENVIEVDFNLTAMAGANISRTVRIVATTSTESAERSFTYAIIPDSPVADVPMGLVNGPNFDPSDATRVTLVLTAPQQEAAFVVGDFNNWELDTDFQMNRSTDGNQYWIELTGLEPGVEYVYQYWVNGSIRVSDPYSDKVLNPNSDSQIPEQNYPNLITHPQPQFGTASILELGREPFQWAASEDTWVRPDKNDLIVYELFLGDFLDSHYLIDMIDTLPYLKRLGINAVELMPIADHEGDAGWGYDPFAMFAPEKFYGTRENLKEFIQAAHQHGIAVIQDIVLNHQTGQNPYNILSRDPATGQIRPNDPFFNQTARHPFNVFEDMNHESPFVQDYADSIVQYWIQEYHFDGYRFDLSKGLTQNNDADDFEDIGQWNDFDQSRIDILTRIANAIWDVDSTAYVILEHFAEAEEERILGERGMLLWGNLHFEVAPLLKGTNMNANLERLRDTIYVNYLESHDEQRIVYEMIENGVANPDYDVTNLQTALDRSKLAAAFFFTMPGPKMIWQWQEYGYDLFLPLNNPGRTDPKPPIWGPNGLGYYEDPERTKLFETYAGIINLTHQFQDVFDNGTLTADLAGPTKSIRIDHETMNVNIIGNFDVGGEFLDPNFASTGTWYDFLAGDSINVRDPNQGLLLAPGEFHIYTSMRVEPPGVDLVPFTNEFEEDLLGVAESDIPGLSVYPNPIGDRFTIDVLDKTIDEVRILTILGEEVLEVKQQFNDLPLIIETAGLETGLYILEINLAGEEPMRVRIAK